MTFLRCSLLVVGTLLLLQAASAADIVLNVESDTEWLVAGGSDSTITATVLDAGGDPVKGISVEFSVEDGMGSFNRDTRKTNAGGIASVNFRPGYRSGSAVITATVSAGGGDPEEVSASCIQRIDHATPFWLVYLDYENEVPVGSTTAITLRMWDFYRNPIDSLRTAETVHFSVGSPEGNAGFIDGSTYVEDIIVPVNESGYLSILLRSDYRTGENIVYIDFPGYVGDRYIVIYGEGCALPAEIACSISPDGTPNPWVPADGRSKFSITYTLRDTYGNPSGGRDIRITALPGEDRTITTNSNGQAMITYGPKESTGTVTLTATAVDDASVTCSEVVEFISRAATDMILSASPQTMASHEVEPAFTADIRAKVMDEKGNAVAGETVTFALAEIDGGDAADGAPNLPSGSALTDSCGYAIVPFVPGSFITDPDDPDYDPMATGTCTVVATWSGVERRLEMTWKNYPYLSVFTSVDPETVEVNGTVNVNVTVRGDGWALQPDPIDVVLVIDRSGSMGGTDISPNRITAAKAAAIDFVDQMDLEKDRIGLVSFSWGAYIDQGLTDNREDIVSAINALSPSGGTNMRRAFYDAIKILKTTGRSDAVKAVILMSDGDWNLHGSPLAVGPGYPDDDPYLSSYHPTYPETFAGYPWSGYIGTYDFSNEKYEWYYDIPEPRGTKNVETSWYRRYPYYSTITGSVCTDGQHTNQNMSVYANSGYPFERVQVYTIGFVTGLDPNVENALTILSESTGAAYTWAGNQEELEQIYQAIAGELKTDAGVNTTMDLRFDTLEVNNVTVPNTVADPVLEYLFVQNESTLIESHIDNTTPAYVVIPPTTCDNTTYWQAHRNLAFDLGTIRLNQTWTARFTLQALKDGNINIFGAGSVIAFNEGSDLLALPDTFITAVPDLNNTGLNASTLEVWNLCRDGTGPIGDLLQLTWNLNYTGNASATQRLYYSTDDRHTWTRFDTLSPVPPGNTTQGGTLDVRGLLEGYYWIRVHATAPDAPDAIAETDTSICVGLADTPKIKIE
ncbi:Ig-like domain-containing protein [Methanofollis fontis]|uniref:VWFA domain-containing protein n=1 Tax=Methanofollis fontis TaxID=2052832 RepID=A0A483CVX0_9EURY|nr:VWA domain-containing protein [Methanofollis fontis]TAJ45280.1 hypothetical protein CUJ86_00585 [Methanofollis fontis]